MFTISFSDFCSSFFYSDFKVTHMPGLSSTDAIKSNVMVAVNIDTKEAYVYHK